MKGIAADQLNEFVEVNEDSLKKCSVKNSECATLYLYVRNISTTATMYLKFDIFSFINTARDLHYRSTTTLTAAAENTLSTTLSFSQKFSNYGIEMAPKESQARRGPIRKGTNGTRRQ
jgi:hypothetical protein